MRNSPFWLVIIGMMLILDIYVFHAIKIVAQSASEKARTITYIIYWTVSVSALLLFIALPYLNLDSFSKGLRSVIFVLVASIFFAKLLASLFLVMDDLRRGFQWVAAKLFFYNTEGEEMQDGQAISRSVFMSWLGLAAGGGLLGSLIYGFSNKYDYQVKKVPISFANLPESFRGLKIVQISDVHSGSFNNKSAVQKGIEKILKLEPDLILFTGDLVNGRADEMANYKEVFSQLKAPMGVYSILGNHDYGDYENWESKDHKVRNLERVKSIHHEMGWRLLLNEHVVLEKNNHRMALIGVENWSAKANFPKYGRLEHAYSGAEEIPFKLLMSHDPSHWDAEVRAKYPDIDLMLAGHTHGMQFGVELPWFRWSPVQYVYRQWAGLYEEGNQKLYVNRGFGFLGYPGRVGILPEITLIELS